MLELPSLPRWGSSPAFSTLDAVAGRPSALSSGPELATVTPTGADVAVFPLGSRAVAVSVWAPFGAVVVFQLAA